MKDQEKIIELNTLRVLINSLKFQLRELNSVNKNIDNLKSKLNSEEYQEEKRENIEISSRPDQISEFSNE